MRFFMKIVLFNLLIFLEIFLCAEAFPSEKEDVAEQASLQKKITSEALAAIQANHPVSTSNPTREEVYELLSCGLETFCENKPKVICLIIRYLMKTDNSMEKLFSLFFDRFSTDFLNDARFDNYFEAKDLKSFLETEQLDADLVVEGLKCKIEIYIEMYVKLKNMIKTFLESDRYENIQEIREEIQNFFKVRAPTLSEKEKYSRFFEHSFSEFMALIEQQLSLKISVDESNLKHRIYLHCAGEWSFGDAFGDLENQLPFFTSSLRSIKIRTRSKTLSSAVLPHLKTIFSEFDLFTLDIVIDYEFCSEVDPNSSESHNYIEFMNNLISENKADKVIFNYFGFGFVFDENRKIVQTNLREKFLRCFPMTVMASLNFKSKLNLQSESYSNYRRATGKPESGNLFLLYFTAIFDYLTNAMTFRSHYMVLSGDSELLSRKDNPILETVHLLKEQRLPNLSLNTPPIISLSKMNFIFQKNWKSRDWNQRSFGNSCFLVLTDTYLCMLRSHDSNIILNSINSRFSTEKYEDLPGTAPTAQFSFSVTSLFLRGQFCNLLYFEKLDEEHSSLADIGGYSYVRYGNNNEGKGFRFRNLKIFMKENLNIFRENVGIGNCHIRSYELKQTGIILTHSNIFPDVPAFLYFTNSIFDVSVRIERKTEVVSFNRCRNNGNVILTDFPNHKFSVFRIKNATTLFKVAELSFRGREFCENNSTFQIEMNVEMESKHIEFLTPWLLTVIPPKIEITNSIFRYQEEALETASQVLPNDPTKFFTFDFNIMKLVTISFGEGIILIRNLAGLDYFHIVFLESSSIKISQDYTRFFEVKFVFAGQTAHSEVFTGSVEEMKRKFNL